MWAADGQAGVVTVADDEKLGPALARLGAPDETPSGGGVIVICTGAGLGSATVPEAATGADVLQFVQAVPDIDHASVPPSPGVRVKVIRYGHLAGARVPPVQAGSVDVEGMRSPPPSRKHSEIALTVNPGVGVGVGRGVGAGWCVGMGVGARLDVGAGVALVLGLGVADVATTGGAAVPIGTPPITGADAGGPPNTRGRTIPPQEPRRSTSSSAASAVRRRRRGREGRGRRPARR